GRLDEPKPRLVRGRPAHRPPGRPRRGPYSGCEEIGVTLQEVARAALTVLERNRRRIDDLNVYPVPDGDTGTNLTLTVRALVDALEESRAGDRATLAREVTRAALMGARGNSGVILSQIVRGGAEALGEADEIDAAAVARA